MANKYKAKSQEIDGHEFPSKRESQYSDRSVDGEKLINKLKDMQVQIANGVLLKDRPQRPTMPASTPDDSEAKTKGSHYEKAAMNNFDKLLGRNDELVELRKEQVLAGAMHIIQQYYADKQNKMEAVAQLFGKKLFDKFHVKLGYDTFSARFSPYGFEIFGEHCMWVTDGQILNKLLTGKAEIVSKC